jgi:HPt (histidine-containing phosphotransfer) domain-containing protein
MTAALERMWTKFVPEIENRFAIVETAAVASSAGTLTTEVREAGHQAAHKLAGILGTFGLQNGTDLARRIEHLLAKDVPTADDGELRDWVSSLKVLIEERNQRK